MKKMVYLIALLIMTSNDTFAQSYCETLNGSWKNDYLYAELIVGYFTCEYALNIHFSTQNENVTAKLKLELKKGYQSICFSELNYELHGSCKNIQNEKQIQLRGDAYVWGHFQHPGRISLYGREFRTKIQATGGINAAYIVPE